MNREDIIRMAQEAGFVQMLETPYGGSKLETFAALVASAERERLIDASMKAAEKAVDVAIALEREACAKIADAQVDEFNEGEWTGCAQYLANNIRARGQE